MTTGRINQVAAARHSSFGFCLTWLSLTAAPPPPTRTRSRTFARLLAGRWPAPSLLTPQQHQERPVAPLPGVARVGARAGRGFRVPAIVVIIIISFGVTLSVQPITGRWTPRPFSINISLWADTAHTVPYYSAASSPDLGLRSASSPSQA